MVGPAAPSVSRAMLLALLLPDHEAAPSCPDEFRAQARQILLDFPARPARWDADLQSDSGLLSFSADFAN